MFVLLRKGPQVFGQCFGYELCFVLILEVKVELVSLFPLSVCNCEATLTYIAGDLCAGFFCFHLPVCSCLSWALGVGDMAKVSYHNTS